MEGEEKRVSSREMTVDEIAHIVRIAVELGISRVKLTGGEPLLRKDIIAIVKKIAAVPSLSDLSMTTNGTKLASLAEQLHANGLQRINITLPTVNEQIYRRLIGGRLEPVLDGVKTAVEVGFYPVKLNMLVLRDINDNAVSEMIKYASETGTVLQLIELEPINISEAYYSKHHKPLEWYEDMLKERAVKVETRQYMQNRRIYHLPKATVEVIRPIENAEFCMHCTRLRVTSDGKLKPCLMVKDNLVDVLTPLRNGANDEELADLFELANQNRQPYVEEKMPYQAV
jgi:cyclic pyranopterin phosphate synthase